MKSFNFQLLLYSFALCYFSAQADFIFKTGKIRTDNSTSTTILFDPDKDGTNEIILDAGGNLGLGTLTPMANVDVVGNMAISGELIVDGNIIMSDGNILNGLVGWWSFDEAKSDGTVLDHSGYGNDGVLNNFTYAGNSVTGKFGKALDFDGVDDYIIPGNFVGLSNDQITLASWVNLNVHKSNNRIMYRDWTNEGWILYVRLNGVVNFSITKGGTQSYASSNPIALNKWVHIVGTYDSANLKTYINGNLEATTGLSNAVLNNTQAIIFSSLGGTQTVDGKLDDIRIYNRALSAKEVHELYTSNQPKLTVGGTVSGNLQVTGNVNITEPLHFNTISTPSTPTTGGIYSAGTNLQFYNGTSWNNLTDGAGDASWVESSSNLLYNSGAVTFGDTSGKQATAVVGNGTSTDTILNLKDNSTSVFVVTDGGNVGIGTSSPTEKLEVTGTVGLGETTLGGNMTIADNIMPSANISYDIGATSASLNATYATDYVLISDRRLKANIQPTRNALARTSKLRPVRYQFKSQPAFSRLGLIAQEVESVVPEATYTGQDPQQTKGLSYHELTSLLLAAEQERILEIEHEYKKASCRLDNLLKERVFLLQSMRKKRHQIK